MADRRTHTAVVAGNRWVIVCKQDDLKKKAEIGACITETVKHQREVMKLLHTFVNELHFRAINHDKTKLEEPEFGCFAKHTSRLKDTTYGSEKYMQHLKNLKVALDHHYKFNRHHPEHFNNGIKGDDID